MGSGFEHTSADLTTSHKFLLFLGTCSIIARDPKRGPGSWRGCGDWEGQPIQPGARMPTAPGVCLGPGLQSHSDWPAEYWGWGTGWRIPLTAPCPQHHGPFVAQPRDLCPENLVTCRGPGSPNTSRTPWGLPYSRVLGVSGSLQDSLCGLKRMPTLSALQLVRKSGRGGGGLPAGRGRRKHLTRRTRSESS